MQSTRRSLARPAAAIVAIVGALALIGQFTVTRALPNVTGAPDALWRMAGYFTVLVNLLLVLHFAGIAAGRDAGGRSASMIAGIVLSIIVVGAVYHTLLSGLWAPTGRAWWADQGLHSATPILATVWWLAFAPKSGLGLGDLARWLLLPLAYCLYAVTRGAATGFWAYPFLDPGIHGSAGVALNIVAMVAVFAGLGGGLLALAAWLDRSGIARA